MKQELFKIAQRLDERYPNGKNPFMIMTRLLEESGELANEVGHFEKTGIKVEKLGEARKEKLAEEACDVMQVVAQLAIYYDLGAEMDKILERRSQDDCEISGKNW